MISNMQSRPVRKAEEHLVENGSDEGGPTKQKGTTVSGNAPKKAKSISSSKSDGLLKAHPVHSNSAPTLTNFFKPSSESGAQRGKVEGKSSLSSFLDQFRHKQSATPEMDPDEAKSAEGMPHFESAPMAAIEEDNMHAAPTEEPAAPKKAEDRLRLNFTRKFTNSWFCIR